jgi:hypothetical protein
MTSSSGCWLFGDRAAYRRLAVHDSVVELEQEGSHAGRRHARERAGVRSTGQRSRAVATGEVLSDAAGQTDGERSKCHATGSARALEREGGEDETLDSVGGISVVLEPPQG